MKKAISPLIAWILLIGFTVTMAAFISNWVIQQTKETFQPEKLLESMSCEGVSFSITKICKEDGSCSKGPDYVGITLRDIQLINKGAFTIRNITTLSLYNPTIHSDNFDNGLIPGESEDMNPIEIENICIKQDGKNEIKLIPAIERDNKVSYCTDNAVILNKESIDSVQECTPV